MRDIAKLIYDYNEIIDCTEKNTCDQCIPISPSAPYVRAYLICNYS